MTSNHKIQLIHGESDYLVFKELKELKKKLKDTNVNITEFYGSKDLSFDEIFNALHSSDLFMTSSTVIVRGVSDSRSLYPYVEKLIDYLDSKSEQQNELYLFNFSKVPKTTRIYKVATKLGLVKEFDTPKPAEIIKVIKQSVNITNEAAELLVQFTNSNLFSVKSEIIKLKNYLLATGKEKIDEDDIELLCIKNINTNEIWSIGDKLLNYVISKDNSIKLKLLKEIDYYLDNNTAVMQILYSFYQYVLNGIKLKMAVKEGKSFKECLSFGYFFTKEFYPKAKSLDEKKLFEVNKQLLGYEFGVKSGVMDEVIGIKKFVLKI